MMFPERCSLMALSRQQTRVDIRIWLLIEALSGSSLRDHEDGKGTPTLLVLPRPPWLDYLVISVHFR